MENQFTHLLFMSAFSSSWTQRWDQKSGRSLSTALQASNQRKDFMEVGEVGGGLGRDAGDLVTNAAGEVPPEVLCLFLPRLLSPQCPGLWMGVLGGWD